MLADQYGKVGNIAQQRQMAEQARSELATVVDEEPSEPEWRRQLALANDLVADADAAAWQVEDALEGYRAALAIRQELAVGDPDNPSWQREIALSHTSIGDMLRRQGQWDAALDAYRAAVAAQERLVAAAPSDARWTRDLLLGKLRVGDMLLKQGGPRGGRGRLPRRTRPCRAPCRCRAHQCAGAVGPGGQPGEGR